MIYKGKDSIPLAWRDFQVDLLPSKCFRRKTKRSIKNIVVHWTATKDYKTAVKVFKRRKVSTHFTIDVCGTIYQNVDLINRAWHAKGFNNQSIGIDFVNPFYLKYQDKDDPWPVIESKVHGRRLGKHLGFKPIQIEAFKALLAALVEGFDITLTCPDKAAVEVKDKHYEGIMCHYHNNAAKIDCAGLELKEIISELQVNGFLKTMKDLFD